ncbi:MAG: hypothetical protein NTZ72_01215 [Afipia sp.]|jgi:hypothetical protein|nr:hypothetical protein [Afipia sp.]
MSTFRIVLILLTLASPAFAQGATQDGVRDAAAATQAAKAFRAYIDGVKKEGGKPDLTKPEVATQLGHIFDRAAFKALPPAQGSDLPWLLDWIEAAKETNKLYIFYGVTLEPKPDFETMGRNMLAYQDQYAVSLDFLLHGFAREASAMKLFMAELPPKERTPIREAALTGFSKNGVENITSSIGAVILGDAKPENVRVVTGAIRDTREAWASFFLPPDRARMIETLAGVLKRPLDETAKADLAAFKDALEAVK